MKEDIEEPESIRTPGKTWTEFPELETSNQSPDIEINSSGDIQIFRGDEAKEKALFSSIVPEKDNSYNAHHYRNLDAVIYIKAEGAAEAHIEHHMNSSASIHLVIDAAKNSDLRITESFTGSAETATSIGEFQLGENATVEYGSVEDTNSEVFYSMRESLTKRDSDMKWLNSFLGANIGIHRSKTVLEGENSSTEMKALWFANQTQHTDAKMEVEHVGEETRCEMDSRGVADDRSRTVYEGLQKVGRNASNTSSFQSEDSLVISSDAEVDAAPKLMIENNEVEASHSASAGRVPEDELYYMKSRGIDDERARKLLVESFFEPVLRQNRLERLEDIIREKIGEKL